MVAVPAAHADPTAVRAVLYGKFQNQIQFAVCFEAPGQSSIEFGATTMSYSWTASGPGGAVVGSDSSPAPGVRYISVPTCPYGYISAYDIRDLTAGTTYAITVQASLAGPTGTTTLSDELVVTTTGGCPVDPPAEEPPAYTYLHAMVGDDNVVTGVYSIAPATILQSPWREMAHWVPTYYGWPGRQYAGIGYIYDPATDNFGPPLPTGDVAPPDEILRAAGLDGCDTDPGDIDVAPTSIDNCEATDSGGIVGTAAGACAVTIRAMSPSGRVRRAQALLMVTGSSRPYVRPIRPGAVKDPAPPRSATPTTGSAVVWTSPAASRTVRSRFRGTRGTSYRISATRVGASSVRGTCDRHAGTVRCAIDLPDPGHWSVAVTPTRNGIAGTAVRRTVVV